MLSNVSQMTLGDTLIAQNVSNGVGGGLYNSIGSTTTINTVVDDLSGIKANRSNGSGAGIYNFGILRVNKSEIIDFPARIAYNVSQSRGGGLYNASNA